MNRIGDQPCNSPTRRSNVTASVITAGTRISFLSIVDISLADILGREPACVNRPEQIDDFYCL